MSQRLQPDTFDFTGYRMPAEWEPHAATWLAWPKNSETWPEHLEPARDAWVKKIRALVPHEKVYLLADGCAQSGGIQARVGDLGAHAANFRMVSIPYDDSWLRDSGPNFIKSGSGPMVINDFIFNTWGGKYGAWPLDDAIPKHAGDLLQIPVIEHTLVLEGGSIDVNGLGTLLTTRQCLLNPNRNPGLRPEQIEERLRQYLGLRHIIWLGEGIEGDDTDGHIDDITRFTSPTHVVTVVEHDSRRANYAPLKKNLEVLEKAVDQDGKSLEIFDLPTPKREVLGPFGVSPASYANFYIANGVVLVPVFSDANDDKALDILQKRFPDRSVIGIESSATVTGLGSIHCVTQQQPAG
jgi:agmatine deiminase